MEAFYRQIDDNRFESTPMTAGPWSPEHQHAGPPSALLARQMAAVDPREGQRLADVRVDILGPVPVVPLEISVEVIRGGRSMELVSASASANGRPALVARAWRILAAPDSYPEVPGRRDPEDPRLLPDDVPPAEEKLSTIPGAHTGGYGSAIEWRFLEGGAGTRAPAVAWGRQLNQLVEGEEPTGWQRTLVLADSGGGISLPVDPLSHRLINCDLHVVLDREPTGEWVRMNSQSIVTPGEGGLVHTELADAKGGIGYGLQTMVAQNIG
ncbi:thioesterase family protein [Brevibacterium daeguense]|uniref:Thioesterase family protein n=1 Tax=Brevibacterium daeguense TaxID=909936 RepID=A0ABP8EHX2_9MICO|nr:thioesterase family protein [Brevibacterium daeguense]